MTSEYVSCGRLCKNVVYYRQFAIELGWSQLTPTSSVLYTDSQSSFQVLFSFLTSVAPKWGVRPVGCPPGRNHCKTPDI